MVKQFKGKVKISDVQAEFDALVKKANSMIDFYNNITSSTEVKDYTVAGPDLAGKGYCLTVGGLKQIMKALDGMVIGGRAYYSTDSKVRMSDGLLITKNEVFRLPSKTVDRPANGNQIYYNTTDKEYEWAVKKISGRQTLTEPGATNLVKQTDGSYKNNTYLDINNNPHDYRIWSEFTSGSAVTHMGFPYGENEINSSVYIKNPIETATKAGVKIDLKNYPHKSLPLLDKAFNNTEIVIMRSGTLTIGKIDYATTFQYSGTYNGGFMLGYYQDGVFCPTYGIYTYEADSSYPYQIKLATDWKRVTGGDTYYFTLSSAVDASGTEEGKRIHALAHLPSYDGNRVIVDNANVPAGQETGEHIVAGWKFNFYWVDGVKDEGTTESHLYVKATPLEEDGTPIKIWNWVNDDKGVFECCLLGKLRVISDTQNLTAERLETLKKEYYVNMVLPLVSTNDTSSYKQSEYNPTFNVTTDKYEVWDSNVDDPTSHHIVDYSPNRDSDERSNVNNLQVQDVYGTFQITTENKIKRGVGTAGCSETINTSEKSCFVTAIDEDRTKGQATATLHLLGQEVSHNRQPGHRNLCYWGPVNFLFLPKGVANPFQGRYANNGAVDNNLIVYYPIGAKFTKEIKDKD